MIKEFELYHGVVLSRLIHGGELLEIKTYSLDSNASYVLNQSIGLYIKYSTKRMTPWHFSFKKNHQHEIQNLKDKFGEVFLVLVCGHDGVVALSYNELKKVLDEDHKEVEWLAIHRRVREKYKVTGSDGKLKYKIGENEFPIKVFKKS